MSTAFQTRGEWGSNWSLVCPECGATAQREQFAAGCQVCAQSGQDVGLVVAYDKLGQLGPQERTFAGIWKHAGLLPHVPETCKVTLGEGDTPLVQIRALTELTGNERIYLKLD